MAAETVRVSKLDCQPNRCAVQEPLTLAVHFAAAKPLPAAWWELKYVVDVASTRHVIELAKTATADLGVGEHKVSLHVPAFDVSKIKRSVLMNVGLLTAVLHAGPKGDELVEIKMVTQITAGATKEQLLRNVLNPLDDD